MSITSRSCRYIDSILEGAEEMFAPLNPTINFPAGKNYQKKALEMRGALVSKVDDFERLRATQSGGPFMAGEQPCQRKFLILSPHVNSKITAFRYPKQSTKT